MAATGDGGHQSVTLRFRISQVTSLVSVDEALEAYGDIHIDGDADRLGDSIGI